MKYTLIIIAVMLALTSEAQTFRYEKVYSIVAESTTSDDYYIALEMHYDTLSNYELIYDPQYLTIRGDTVKGILSLLKYSNEEMERTKNVYRERQYAEDIISNIRTDGYVTNWKDFRKAVDRYMKFKAYKAVMKQP